MSYTKITPVKNGRENGAVSPSSGIFSLPDGRTLEIREVWASNLEEEMAKICEHIEKFPFVAMDTEFPGVVAKPISEYGAGDMIYQTLKCNVDMLKLIQLGLTLTDSEGNWIEGCTCWQFNFKFSLVGDMFAQDSIEMLKQCGIDFDKFEKDGIDIIRFGELLTMSGLVLNDDVKWLSFHSSYDFGYLLKTLTCDGLPQDETAFLDLLHTFFPCIYDVKYMMTAVEGLYGGLNALAECLKVERIGPMHQAGSDSLLTAQTYFSLFKGFFSGKLDDTKYKGELFGLGNNHTRHRAKQYMQSNVVSNGSLLPSSSAAASNSTTVTVSGGSASSAASMSSNGSNGNPYPSLSSQMQYYPNVHYPLNQNYGGYDDHYAENGY